METIEKPLLYLDRQNKRGFKYLFISYSHLDCQVVYPLLNELFDHGVNYWYDDNLLVGDIWDEKALEIMRHKACAGCIFFLSKNSLISLPVHQEIEAANEIIKTNKSFNIFPVMIDVLNLEDAKKILFQLGVSKGYDFYKKCEDNLDFLMENGKRTYCKITDNDCVQKLALSASQNGASEDSKLLITNEYFQNLPNVKHIDSVWHLYLGDYPSDMLSESNVSKIDWVLVDKEDSLLYFVTEFCIDFLDFDSAQSKIRDIATHIKSQVDYVKCISFVSRKIAKQLKDHTATLPTDYADSMREQKFRVYWVEDGDGKNKKYDLYNSENYPVMENLSMETDRIKISAGLKLMLEIDDKKIKNYLEE